MPKTVTITAVTSGIEPRILISTKNGRAYWSVIREDGTSGPAFEIDRLTDFMPCLKWLRERGEAKGRAA